MITCLQYDCFIMDDMYIVVPSNSTNDNTPSNFQTTFAIPIHLNDNNSYEVALTEISFSNSIKTIQNEYFTLCYEIERRKYDPIKTTLTNNTNEVKTINDVTHYKLTDDYKIFDIMRNWQAPEGSDLIAEGPSSDIFSKQRILGRRERVMYLSFLITYSSLLHRFQMEVIYDAITVTLTKELCDILGFRQTDFTKGIHLAPDPPTSKYKMEVNKKDGSIDAHVYIPLPLDFDLRAVIYKKHDRVKLDTQVNKLRPGFYSTPQELESELNKVALIKERIQFIYNPKTNRFTLKTDDSIAYLQFHEGLKELIGFTDHVYHHEAEVQEGLSELNLQRGITNAYIHCDLMDPIRVGNTTIPLLHTIYFTHKDHTYGQLIHEIYENRMYHKVKKTFIDTIQISICDYNGDPIPITEGITTLVLHLRSV